MSLVNKEEDSDILFKLNDPRKSKVFGHRALILSRLISREMSIDANENVSLQQILNCHSTPDFIRKVSQSPVQGNAQT